jgi:hypothetical protein
LYIQSADDAVAGFKGQGHFGAGVGQVRVVEEHRVFAYIECDPGFSMRGYISDDTLFANSQSVPSVQHVLSAFTVGCL